MRRSCEPSKEQNSRRMERKKPCTKRFSRALHLQCFVAEADDSLVGYATCTQEIFPPGRPPSICIWTASSFHRLPKFRVSRK
jgi:hypothetical protein